MDVDSAREATETGCGKRRNPFPFSPSTFLRILKSNLKLHPFKYVFLPYLEHFKTEKCVGYTAKIRRRSYFKNLLVSDECWLTLGGHVFNRC